MMWRGACVGLRTRSLGIALAGAACLTAPAAAQLARVSASPTAPKLIVVTFGRVQASDSDIAMEISDAVRERMRLARAEDFNVISKKGMCDNLEASGFSCAAALEPTQVGQLANVLNARYILDGMIFTRAGDSLLVMARLVQASRTNAMATIASVTVPRGRLSASMWNTLADRLADKYRSFEYITNCRNQREQKNYPKALEAANRALRYDPQSGGAFLCIGLSLLDQGASTDSVQATLERAHDADSLNTTVGRQLAAIYEQKHDTAQLLHMLHHILQVDINDVELRKATAQIYVKRGFPDSAVMVIDEALARNPNQFDLVLVKSISQAAGRKWADAAATMATAAELDSSKIDSVFVLHIITYYDSASDSVRAFEWVHRATQRVPNEPAYWYRYGLGLLARNDTTGAMESVKQFMTLLPGDGRGHIVYATLLQAKGQADSAVAHARMAVDADSGYRPAAGRIFLLTGVAALQAPPNYARADSMLGQAKPWVSQQLQGTASFYLGFAQFQEGYAAMQAAQTAQGALRNDPSQRDVGCNAVKSGSDFLNKSEPNVTAGAAVDRDRANTLLTQYIPQIRTALTQLSRVLRCPS
jgi:tetratricopeptide (TPR) repeat protein